MTFTLTGNGQIYNSSVQPTYDAAYRFWRCQDAAGMPFNVADMTGATFTVSGAALLPLLTPMTFYLAFTPAERIAIKGSADPQVKEFWDTFSLAQKNNTPIDPNLVSVKNGVQYLSVTNQSPSPAPAWAASAAVKVGDQRAVGTNVYTCTTAGTTGATAPSGTGTGIADGTAVWSYTATPYIAPSRVSQVLAGIPQ